MAYIRTPVATNMRQTRQCRSSPRCLVVALSISFLAFNWIVLYSFHRPSADPFPDAPEAPPREDPPSLQLYPASAYLSSSNDALWAGHWFRWRGIDSSYAEQTSDSLRFDIVYTWVNGSDPALQKLRHDFQSRSPIFSMKGAGDFKSVESVTARRFRDMDELRYSVRSTAEYAKDLFRQIHLLTTETEEGQSQVPVWLNLPSDQIETVPHTTIFRNRGHLPSFNSLAIESNIHHVPGLSDVFMYLNDDVFLGTTMLPSDIWTELYGFVFHMEGGLLVPPTIRPTEANPLNIGEWSSLQFSNYLLSERFGPRFRAYLAHVPHVLSVPMLSEIQDQWPQEFDSTSSHRFRGEGEARDIQVSFFMAHYVMEKLRETQLASYWTYRLDQNGDGALDWDEREALIDMVEIWNHGQQTPGHPQNARPSMIAGYERVLKRVGTPLSGSTSYRLAGLDGYPFMLQNSDTSKTIPVSATKNAEGNNVQPQTPYHNYESSQSRTCQLDLQFCLGENFLSPSVPSISVAETRRIFDRLAVKEFHCGDCLLHILMHHPAEGGMSAWMPQDEDSVAFQRVVQDVKKYNYVLGTSEYSFYALQDVDGATKNLQNLLTARNSKAFFCINDDYPDDPDLEKQIYGIFKNFLDTRFPVSSPWEKPSTTE